MMIIDEKTGLLSKIRRTRNAKRLKLQSSIKQKPFSARLLICLLIAVVAGTILISTSKSIQKIPFTSSFGTTVSVVNSDPTAPVNDRDIFSTDVSGATLEFTFSRDGYKPLDYFSSDPSDLFAYDILDGYAGMIEPNAAMNLYITSGYTDMLYYEYTVCSESNDCADGILASSNGGGRPTTSVTIDCEPFSVYSVEVSVLTTDSGKKVDSQTGSLICMYVRREIRSLSTDDYNALLNAMYTLWITPEEEGQELYGEDYHDISYVTEMHHFGAAWQDGDHIHEGLGFLPQHIKITTIFEKSVQAVDSSVSIPYWDYTIETAAGENIFNNDLFSDSGFGSVVSPGNNTYGWTYDSSEILAGIIPDSLWANTKALVNTKYGDLQNSFGYLRGPWNMNPSPYLSRFPIESGTLPGCSSHYTLLTYDDMMTFLAEAPYGSHASTHGSIGGVFGCDEFSYLTDLGYINDVDSQVSLCNNWGFYVKELYRANYIKPWTNCSYSLDNVNSFECGFTCNEDYEDLFADKLDETISSSYRPEDMPTAGWSEWKSFICEGNAYKVFTGDQLESASPLDPSFWMIHPTQERLLHAKYMSGGFTNSTWPTDQVNDFICSKGICYEDEYGSKDSYKECCFGHNQYDQLLDFINANKTGGFGPTNDFVLKANDPKSSLYSMEYIYDSYAWPHCAEQDSDFNELLWSFYHRNSDIEAPDDIPGDVPTFEPTTSPPTLSPTTAAPTFKPTNFVVMVATQYTNIFIASVVSTIGLLIIFLYEFCVNAASKRTADVVNIQGEENGEYDDDLDDYDDFEEGQESEVEEDPNQLLFSFYKQTAFAAEADAEDEEEDEDVVYEEEDDVADISTGVDDNEDYRNHSYDEGRFDVDEYEDFDE